MQQIDIMPTVLRILGYNQPFSAFGKNVFDPNQPRWAVNYDNGIYQYIDGDYTLLFDGEKATALYNFANDPLQRVNLLDKEPDRVASMEKQLKALVQSYMIRMSTNNLVLRD